MTIQLPMARTVMSRPLRPRPHASAWFENAKLNSTSSVPRQLSTQIVERGILIREIAMAVRHPRAFYYTHLERFPLMF
jgi:hypothetical protein